MTGPRPEVVALLTAVDTDTILAGTRRHDGTPLEPSEVDLVRGATYDEVRAARDVLARRLALRGVGGDGDEAA